MGIVRFALRFPHTFYVMAALIVFLGVIAVRTMPADIFPEINIPVVTVIWSYTGLSTPEMEQRVSTYSQYSISANVNGIKNMEAQTLNGLSVQKIYFQPDVNLDLAIAQIVSATNSIRALMPAGIQPPVIVAFNASSVPVLQLSLSSDTLSEQQLYDYGIYRVRQQLAPVPGVTLPTPAGGKYRQIMVDIDPAKLVSRGLTPLDVVNAVNAQNLTLPSGTAKIGDTQYAVLTNATPASIQDLNDIPISSVNGATVFVKDVGQVHDGWLVQQNVVRDDGHRSVLLSIIKNGNASTLNVVNGVRAALETLRAAAPAGMKISELFDQSVFVTQSVAGVVREGAIAAGLTALMILLFLGSWRSTLVVDDLDPARDPFVAGGAVLPRPHAQHDDARRSCARGRHPGRRLHGDDREHPSPPHRGGQAARLCDAARRRRDRGADARLDARHQLRVHLGGVPRRAGEIPVHAARPRRGVRDARVLRAVAHAYADHHRPASQGRAPRRQRRPRRCSAESTPVSSAASSTCATVMRALLSTLLRRRFIVPAAAVLVLGLGGVMFELVGHDFFPLIDGGQIQLHVRAPAGTRIEATERVFQEVEDKIREVIPDRDRDRIVDNIGLPARAYNLAFADGSTIGVNDGVILVALKEGHAPTADYVRKLRTVLPAAFPDTLFYFQPADIVTQILNFGLPSQIDVRTVGYDRANNLRVANELRQRIGAIPGIADAHLQQEVDAPAFYAMIDRTRASQLGLNASTIATNLNVSLSSSEQVTPNFWTDPTSGIPYYLAVQTPESRVASLNDLANTPVSAATTGAGNVVVPGLLSNVATFKRGSVPTNTNQNNIQPVYDVYASIQGRDLGSVAADIDTVVADLKKQLKPGNTIQVVGQIQSMNDSFRNLGLGLLFAAVLVYLLMVVNYQNFGDPFVVILALPATFCGILVMLYITGTTLNVPSLMGAIMAVGVASANSILLVTFAREQQVAGHSAFEAALSAGRTRIRPVLMTAAAMIVGMIPMAIGGAGEEQNAALARAVIGGLLFATPTTLLVVPYLFALLRKGNDGKSVHGVFEEHEIA